MTLGVLSRGGLRRLKRDGRAASRDLAFLASLETRISKTEEDISTRRTRFTRPALCGACILPDSTLPDPTSGKPLDRTSS